MKRRDRIISLIVMLCMVLTVIPTSALAATDTQGYSDAVIKTDAVTFVEASDYEAEASSWRFEDGNMIKEKPSLWERMVRATSSKEWTWSDSQNGYLSSDGTVIDKAVRKGIDVSKWNGDINWEKVKADGIDFAIIRCGFGDDYKSQDDTYWKINVEACEKYDIPYGVYIYSYAESDKNVESEIKHVLRCLKDVNAKPDYPVYYDLEDKVVRKCGRTKIIKWANMFCEAVEKAGYRAGVYASLYWWDTYLNDSSLNKYEKWVAQWNNTCTYKGSYSMWQCTSDGSVAGIKGRVDVNFEMDFITPTVTNGLGTRDDEMTATIQFVSSEVGKLYYSVVEMGAPMPVIDTTGMAIDCVNGVNKIVINNLLGVGAKDIYIQVMDAAGNISNILKITVPTVNYSIVGNTSQLQFDRAQMGYQTAMPQVVTVTNTGLNPITLQQPVANNYTVGQLSVNELAPNEAASFTVQPNMGLQPGGYSEVITVWGDNGVSAQLTVSFVVDKANIGGKQVLLSQNSFVYDGSAKLPTVLGVEGLLATDYTVAYKDSNGKNITSAVYPGTYTVVITGKGNYSGTTEGIFTIQNPSVKKPDKVTASLYGYDDIKVTWSTQKIAGATVKYKVEYKKDKGKWKVLSSGTKSSSIKKKDLADGAKYTFRVTPYVKVNGVTYEGKSKSSSAIYTLKKVSTPKISKSSSKYIKIKWTNISGESGYEIARSTKKKSGFKVIKTLNSKAKSYKLKTTKNKTYYYKVRAYKTVNGKKIYGPWSSVKSYKLK